MNANLVTEARNPASEGMDALPTAGILAVINAADAEIAAAVRLEIPRIAASIDRITERIQAGGRLFYAGAGTSGRLGVLDASECPPTFHTPPGLVIGLIAGGDRALRHSVERAEDDPGQGGADLEAHRFSSVDSLVGIAASGRTPYVIGALRRARELGGLPIALSCVPEAEIGAHAEISIAAVVGPEILTGSTRMRAGTATKLVLNMISTGTMVRLGYVYKNLMVNVQPTNSKLEDRAARIVAEVAGLSYDEAARLLHQAGSVRTAIVMHTRKLERSQAEALLTQNGGRLREALAH